ncbi:MAG TPA: precorrin-6y C5,15-methyltransferase (decarboxylating) subunit CbiE, partial [Acidimicrobiales bacterium]|nr:precorrin-6y C5,15-methyltransferase (decarboxylating) subunit CbiE [Acidimicrobiales bacterium]
MPDLVAVVGVAGGQLGGGSKDATRAVEGADLVVGATRHLDAVAPAASRRLALTGDLRPALDAVAAEPGRVCVLASGDPGFFGIVRVLAERFGPELLEVHPAPSSVAVAFARLGLPWDDAVVASAHGRPLPEAARRAAAAPKAAVLTSPDARPEDLGRELITIGARHRRVIVGSHLGEDGEAVAETDLVGLAGGPWDPLSVVVLLDGPATAFGSRRPATAFGSRRPATAFGPRRPATAFGPRRPGVAEAPVLAWGLPEADFAHREGMVTKSEVRAVALGKLALPPAGVLWDVGAGSGSVAVECARLAPGLRVLAVERDPGEAGRIRANAAAHGVTVEVVEGEAPTCLAELPAPDRAFVGGGGLAVLDAVLARVAPGGRVVATYAALDRAAAAAPR